MLPTAAASSKTPTQTALLAINGITGHLCEITAELTWVVADIKQAIQMQLGVPTFQQILLAKDTELDDNTALIEKVSTSLNFIPESHQHFLNGKTFTMIRVPHMPESFLRDWYNRRVPKELCADRGTVMSVLQQLGEFYDDALGPADPMLRADRDVVLAAVGRNGRMLKDASPELKADRELVLVALSTIGSALEFAADELKRDAEVVRAAVRSDGLALQFAAEEFKRDVEIVRAAVKSDGLALQHAAPDLRSNHDISVLAVQQNVDALEYAPHLQRNRSIIMDAVSRNTKFLRYAGNDRDIVLHALEFSTLAMWEMEAQWWEDIDVTLAIVRQDGWLLQYLPAKMRSNRQVVRTAVEQNGWALVFAPTSLQADPEVVTAAVQKDGLAIQYASPALRANRHIAVLAVREDAGAFHHVAPALQSDPDFCSLVERCQAME